MDGGAGGGQEAAGETDAGPASVNMVESTKGEILIQPGLGITGILKKDFLKIGYFPLLGKRKKTL